MQDALIVVLLSSKIRSSIRQVQRFRLTMVYGTLMMDDSLNHEEAIMQRRKFMELLAAAGSGIFFADQLSGAEPSATADKQLIGMYVHECWVYNRPYAARAWTEDDWRGYLDGLSRLGYNLISIWPQLEIVPQPMTASDKAKLDLHRRVIDIAHKEFGMKAWIILCPNNSPIDEYARRAKFEDRFFYANEVRNNPADPKSMDALMARREELLASLVEMDGLVIIDSDPGGYPDSTNEEFVDLLMRHRRLLDKLRPGKIELVYWVWAGWQACARYHNTGVFEWGTEAEFLETLKMLKQRNPEPWGIARGLEYAQKVGLESKVINFNYGALELEPVFPMTNFGPHAGGDPYKSGQDQGPRGTQANAQTHCVQLPGTFAFSRGARGMPLTDADYVGFAEDLIRGQGDRIFKAWKALAGKESESMKQIAAEIHPLLKAKLETGPLKGFLFGDCNRFLKDLYLMLRLKAAAWDFINASHQNRPLVVPLGEFVSWLDRWQVTTGYQMLWNFMYGTDLNSCLQKLDSPRLNEFFRTAGSDYTKTLTDGTPLDRILATGSRVESETSRFMNALKQTLWEMELTDAK